MGKFSTAVVRWQRRFGRHDLPWQQGQDAYRIWLSEVMLQQTQVAAVIPYYAAFLRRFPTLAVLARAREESVLAQWSGLGYYARARHLHAAARWMHAHGMPSDAAGWQALPGVGRSTAAAIAVFAHGQRCAILDGNVKRVLARTQRLQEEINTPAGEAALWAHATALLPPARSIRPYTQGLMDIGATICRPRQPLCASCPLAQQCGAYQCDEVAHYPRRRARKAKPQKTAHYALVLCGDAVLLQRRPPRGIWGGLWTLPEVDGAWRGLFGAELGDVEEELEFMHAFTHYTLHARVSVYRVGNAVAVTAPLRWHKNWRRSGVPAPVKRVLNNFL